MADSDAGVAGLDGSRRRYLLVCSGALFAIATEALIGFLLPLLALQQQLPPAQLGVLVAVGSIAPILFALPGGAFCDHFGDRRMMMISAIGVGLSTLAYTRFDDFFLLCGVAVVGGFFRGMSWVATQSYAMRFISAERRQRFMGHFSFVAGLGMLITPLVAGWLSEHIGLNSGFYFMACWGGSLFLVAWLLPNLNRSVNRDRKIIDVMIASYVDALPLLARPVIVVIMAFTLLRLASAAINSSFYPVHLNDIGTSITVMGQLFALIHVGTSLGTLVAAPLGRRFSTATVLGFSVALSMFSIAMVPFYHSVMAIAFWTLLHGLGQGISLPQILAAIGRHTDHSERGLVLGMRSMFNRVGYLFVPVMLGVIMESSGLQVAFVTVAGGLLLLVAVSTIALSRIDHS